MTTLSIVHSIQNTWQCFPNSDGWSHNDTEQVTLFKSPTLIPNLNLCILKDATFDPRILGEYYQRKPFSILHRFQELENFRALSSLQKSCCEMELPISSVLPPLSPHITPVCSIQQLQEWAYIASRIFGFFEGEIMRYIREFYKLPQGNLYLYVLEGQPVGIGQVSHDKTGVSYIGTIGVLSEFQRQGIGQALIEACLRDSSTNSSTSCTILASQQGESLYTAMGFQKIERWNYWVF